jgi:hypothetical protein
MCCKVHEDGVWTRNRVSVASGEKRGRFQALPLTRWVLRVIKERSASHEVKREVAVAAM